MFVDASALVAILTGEEDADELADVLERARSPITSPIAIFEAALGVSRKYARAPDEAYADVIALIDTARIAVVGIELREAELAVDAWRRYGKASGHPARLNMGDCFAYAIARSHQAVLLFKGDDFVQTDVPPARPA